MSYLINHAFTKANTKMAVTQTEFGLRLELHETEKGALIFSSTLSELCDNLGLDLHDLLVILYDDGVEDDVNGVDYTSDELIYATPLAVLRTASKVIASVFRAFGIKAQYELKLDDASLAEQVTP